MKLIFYAVEMIRQGTADEVAYTPACYLRQEDAAQHVQEAVKAPERVLAMRVLGISGLRVTECTMELRESYTGLVEPDEGGPPVTEQNEPSLSDPIER